MFFTQQEKQFLLSLSFIFFVGLMIQAGFKQYPFLKYRVNILDSSWLYPKVNINTATVDDLEKLPYIGAYTARNIVDYRRIQGPFTSIDQIKKVQGIKEKNYQKFKAYIIVSEGR